MKKTAAVIGVTLALAAGVAGKSPSRERFDLKSVPPERGTEGACAPEAPISFWYSLGPLGSMTDALAVDPFQPHLIYAGSSWGGGLYKSDFEGNTRLWIGKGMTDDHVTGVAASPDVQGRLFASTLHGGVFRSDDGGSTWTCVTGPGVDFYGCNGLLMDPSDSEHLIAYGTPSGTYALRCEGVWDLPSDGGYVETFDAGATWTFHDLSGGREVGPMALDPSDPQKMYARLKWAQSADFASTQDGGAHWSVFAPAGGSIGYVETLAVSPVDGRIVTGSDPPKVSTDGGHTWTPKPSLSGNCCQRGVVFSRATPGFLWAGGVNFFTSSDNAGTFSQKWQGVSNPPYPYYGYHFDIRSVAERPKSGGGTEVLLGTDGGLFATSDQGGTFQWQSGGKPAFVYRVAIDPSDGDHFICSMQDFQGAYTTDGGSSWGYTSCPEAGKFLFHRQSPTQVYWSTGNGVRKSTDGGVSFVNAASGLPGTAAGNTFAFDLNPNNGNALVVGTGSGPYYSYDGAMHWQAAVISMEPGDSVMDVVASPAFSDIFYLLTTDSYWTRSQIFRSVNNGVTWSLRAADAPPMQRLHADPFDWNTLYGTNWQNCGEDGLYVSTNGGSSWVHKPGPPVGAVTQEGFEHSLPVWADRQAAGHLWMGTGLGIAHTDDYGDHWSDFSPSLHASQVCDIAQDPSDPDRLFAATYGMGLARYASLWLLPLIKIYPLFEVIQGVAPFYLSGSSLVTGGTEPYSYSWDYGDGSPPDSSPRALHVYSRPGSYTVRLTVTDADGQVSWSPPVAVEALEPLTVTATGTPSQGSPPLDVAFESTVVGGAEVTAYDWDFGDGTAHGSGSSCSHTYSSPGLYEWSLTVTDAGGGTGSARGSVDTRGRCQVDCQAAVPEAFTVGRPATFEATATANECLSAPTFHWDFGDGISSDEPSATHAYATPGAFAWTLTAEADGVFCRRGGTATAVEAAACSLTSAGSAQPPSGTAPLAVAFTGDAAATDCTEPPSYFWSFGDGAVSSLQNPSHEYATPGTYTWSVTASANGRSGSASGEVTVLEPPCTLTCDASVAERGQTGTPVSFAGSASADHCQGGPAYAWDFGDGATSTLPSPAHAYTLPGTYTWSMTVSADGETCTRQGTLEIVQAPAVTSLSKAASPFRVKVLGSHFEEGVQVFLGGSAQAWPNVIRKSETRLVLKGGASLKALFPKGVAVVVRVVNPDGGWAEGLFTR